MPRLRVTWVICHERPLYPDEDPHLDAHRVDPDAVLWAIEDGTVQVSIEIVE